MLSRVYEVLYIADEALFCKLNPLLVFAYEVLYAADEALFR